MDRRTLLQTALAMPFIGVGDRALGNYTSEEVYSPFNPSFGPVTNVELKRDKMEISILDKVLEDWIVYIIIQYKNGSEFYCKHVTGGDSNKDSQDILSSIICDIKKQELFNHAIDVLGNCGIQFKGNVFWMYGTMTFDKDDIYLS